MLAGSQSYWINYARRKGRENNLQIVENTVWSSHSMNSHTKLRKVSYVSNVNVMSFAKVFEYFFLSSVFFFLVAANFMKH